MKALRLFSRLLLILSCFSTSAILCQDFLIFPGALDELFFSSHSPLPDGVQEHLLQTTDGQQLGIWELPAQQPGREKQVALILHGNGGDVRLFLRYQQWFRERNITSYDFDYRGFGKSSGWITEENLYKDAQQVAQFVAEREQIPSERLILLGISVGSGPSAYLASKLQSKILIIDSGYSSIPEVVNSMPIYKHLATFLHFRFPTKEYLKELSKSCIILTHGKNDFVIPYENLGRLTSSVAPTNQLSVISSQVGEHNNTFFLESDRIFAALQSCQ